MKEVVYAEPANVEARALCADALEQMGYQAESATWRNALPVRRAGTCATASSSFRRASAWAPTPWPGSPATCSSTCWRSASIRQRLPANPQWSTGIFTDRDEKLVLTLSHCTLSIAWANGRRGSRFGHMERSTLDLMVLGKVTAPEALASGALKVDGDLSRFVLLFAMLDSLPASCSTSSLRVKAGPERAMLDIGRLGPCDAGQ